MTDEEHDLLQLVYAEAEGQADKWMALTELPLAVMALQRNGYLAVLQDSPDTWRIALTDSGRVLARSSPLSSHRK